MMGLNGATQNSVAPFLWKSEESFIHNLTNYVKCNTILNEIAYNGKMRLL